MRLRYEKETEYFSQNYRIMSESWSEYTHVRNKTESGRSAQRKSLDFKYK